MKKCMLFRKVYTKPVNDGSPNTDKKWLGKRSRTELKLLKQRISGGNSGQKRGAKQKSLKIDRLRCVFVTKSQVNNKLSKIRY